MISMIIGVNMHKASLVEPHGGALVDLLVDQERSVLLKDIALNPEP